MPSEAILSWARVSAVSQTPPRRSAVAAYTASSADNPKEKVDLMSPLGLVSKAPVRQGIRKGIPFKTALAGILAQGHLCRIGSGIVIQIAQKRMKAWVGSERIQEGISLERS
jgi:hypothetical protein